jgi:hypothetical protein
MTKTVPKPLFARDVVAVALEHFFYVVQIHIGASSFGRESWRAISLSGARSGSDGRGVICRPGIGPDSPRYG